MATVVFLHAHPDDEASQTSGSMARASAQGHRVVVVYGTNGDHGEVPQDLAEGDTVLEFVPGAPAPVEEPGVMFGSGG